MNNRAGRYINIVKSHWSTPKRNDSLHIFINYLKEAMDKGKKEDEL